jgi:pyridoxine 4-dehydrogenase
VVNLRNMNRVWTDSIAEHFGALAELRDAGLIRHLGVSNVSADHLAEAQAIAPVVCVQNRYGVDARRADADDFLRACGAQRHADHGEDAASSQECGRPGISFSYPNTVH